MDVLGKMTGFPANKAVSEGMIRIAFDGLDPAILDLDQKTTGVRAIFRTNRAFPHG
jgi:hypothetical protein